MYKQIYMRVQRFFKSIADAARGVGVVARSEQNFRFQIVVTLVVIVAMCYFRVPLWQAIVLVLLCTLILVLELINTAVEYFTDLLKPRLHHHVRTVKDIMAGAVLIASVSSVIIGGMIFIPYFLALLK